MMMTMMMMMMMMKMMMMMGVMMMMMMILIHPVAKSLSEGPPMALCAVLYTACSPASAHLRRRVYASL